ncbi:MAG: histidine--tRNA ligase [Parachlamydiales bacterium]
MSFQIPKGLFDILPYGTSETWQLTHYWHYVETAIRKIALDYGLKELRTPIFEHLELFVRGAGESSDLVVKKEMYAFQDKAERKLALRPEGTASLLRSFIENRLNSVAMPYKFYYVGPMFRYDRPQAGRYRQHHQFGVEVLGVDSYEQDVEVIDLLCELYRRLGLKEFVVHINTVGDTASRLNYKKALQDYLHPALAGLSEDSKVRFEKNPLRILDSKDPADRELIKDAPKIRAFLTPEAENHFEKVLRLLKILKIPYLVDDQLVRGLDYYKHTVFEVVSTLAIAQNSLGGGGRYDGMLKDLGGTDLAGIGFGTGLERVIQTLIAQKVSAPDLSGPFVYFIPLEEKAREKAFLFATQLRHEKIPADCCLIAKKIDRALKIADSLKAPFAVIIGEEEIKKGAAQVKNMQKRESAFVAFDSLFEYLQKLFTVQSRK